MEKTTNMKCSSNRSILDQEYAYVRVLKGMPDQVDIDSFEEGCVKARVVRKDCQCLAEYELGGKTHAIPISESSVMSYKPKNLQLIK